MTLKTCNSAHNLANRSLQWLIVLAGLLFLSSCGIYSFTDASFPTDIKTVKVSYIENKARYINPRLSPQITTRLQEKIMSQTKLTTTDNSNADWVITGYVSGYDITTSGISGREAASNRLNVTVNITLRDNVNNKSQDFSVVKSFEFGSGQTLQAAESSIGDNLIKGITDEIFNRIFSNW